MPTLRQRLRSWRLPFTVTGRLMTVALVFSLLAILDDSLTGLLSYLLWLLIPGFLCGLYFRPALKIQVVPTELITNGESFEVVLNITNTGRMHAYDVQCSLNCEHPLASTLSPESKEQTFVMLSTLAPGERTQLAFPLKATQRGVFRIQSLRTESLFPLSLFRFVETYALGERVVVAPAFATERFEFGHNESGRSDMTELAGQNRRKGQLEYTGSREYRPGMPVRRWDFTSWARLGSPAVREFSEASESLSVVVVDVTRQSMSREDATLERVLSVAATAIDHNLRDSGPNTILVLVGDTVEYCDARDFAQPDFELLKALAEVNGVRASTGTRTVRPHAEQAAHSSWSLAWDQILASMPADAEFLTILHGNNEAAISATNLVANMTSMQIHIEDSVAAKGMNPSDMAATVSSGEAS